MDARHSTCMMQTGECRRKMNSSCTTSWDGWFLFVPSRSQEHRAPDQTPVQQKSPLSNHRSNKPKQEATPDISDAGWLTKQFTASRTRYTNLTKIHDDALMNLLPQVSPEDLNQGDLQCGDLAVHKDSSQIKLHLETHIHLNRGE